MGAGWEKKTEQGRRKDAGTVVYLVVAQRVASWENEHGMEKVLGGTYQLLDGGAELKRGDAVRAVAVQRLLAYGRASGETEA